MMIPNTKPKIPNTRPALAFPLLEIDFLPKAENTIAGSLKISEI